MSDVAELLAQLPLLADRIIDMPQQELRALFDRLQLDIVRNPAESALDVAFTR
jgi:hypothetical protein